MFLLKKNFYYVFYCRLVLIFFITVCVLYLTLFFYAILLYV